MKREPSVNGVRFVAPGPGPWEIERAHFLRPVTRFAVEPFTRSGHVYVISNIGSFGEHVYKIGMTRRLDPFDRVHELGDASVPFGFDVHAMIYSDDAPAMENTLHRAFHERRINLINEKKEFFQVDIEEIARTVRRMHGEIEITRVTEAEQYRKTVAMRQEREAAQHASAPARLAPQAQPVAAYAPA